METRTYEMYTYLCRCVLDQRIITMVHIPTDREPTHPGEMILEEFLIPMGISQKQLADAMHVPFQRVNEIVNRRRGVTTETALRLSRVLGMSPGFWLKLQMAWDLYHEQQNKNDLISTIPPKPFAHQSKPEQLITTTTN